jgi:hypothetical protein
MKRLFIFSILVLSISQGVMAKETKRHQQDPAQPIIREWK